MSKIYKLVQKQKESKVSKKDHFNLEAITNANRRVKSCFCGSNKSYKTCCEPIHFDITLAQTPLALMKSRYVAFVLSKIEHLMLSHHSSTRPCKDEANVILAWTKSVTWLGLEIVDAPNTTDEIGYVTFNAHFLENGVRKTIHEKSRFVKENNHWTYINGTHIN